MARINSDNIYVYPSSRRGANYPESRILAESGLVNLVNKLIDREGFVISDTTSGAFEFNIFGYYFKVNSVDNITDNFSNPSSGDIIYGVITLDTNIWGLAELSGQDEASSYTGIEFQNSLPAQLDTKKYLALLTYDGSNWTIPTESKFKFDSSSLQGFNIDGGTVTP